MTTQAHKGRGAGNVQYRSALVFRCFGYRIFGPKGQPHDSPGQSGVAQPRSAALGRKSTSIHEPCKGVTSGCTHAMSQSLVKILVHLVYSTRHRQPWPPDDVRDGLFACQAGIFQRLSCPFRATGCGETCAPGRRSALPWADMSLPLQGVLRRVIHRSPQFHATGALCR
jgi:hypothetical protein